jgi:hypothetical protein
MTAILILLKASVVIAATAVALGLFGRRASAAWCHLVCTLAIGGLLLLPLLSWALPAWEAVQLAALETTGAVPLLTSSQSSSVRYAPADSDRSESVISDSNHGYVRELQSLGYALLNIEDLEGLRSHGVTPPQVQRANARSGTRLSVDRLTSLAANGWK